jgi:protein-S-isoprenylcysteine O-methyltransferase Ste14
MFGLILAVLLWGVIHSVLASQKAKTLVLSWFGESPARFYRLVYNLLAGFSFLPVLVIAAVTPDRRLYAIIFPWSALMGLGEFLAVVVLVAGFRQTDVWEFIGLRQVIGTHSNEQSKNTPESKQSHLVTSGLYRYVRHPLYLAGLAFIWLLPIMTLNILAINLALTVYIIVGAYFEERKLRREYGQEYTDYAEVTPMLIPFLKRNKTRL